MFFSLALSFAAALAAQPSAETNATPVPPPGAETGDSNSEVIVTGKQQEPRKDKKVCKRSTATGSIMPKVTCRMESEWNLQRERDLVALEKLKADRVSRDNTQLARER